MFKWECQSLCQWREGEKMAGGERKLQIKWLRQPQYSFNFSTNLYAPIIPDLNPSALPHRYN